MDIFDKNNFERLRKYGLGNVQVTATNKDFGYPVECGWSVEPHTFDVTFNLDEIGLHRLQEALYMWLARHDGDEEKKIYAGEPYEDERFLNVDERADEGEFLNGVEPPESDFLEADERVAEDDMQLCSRFDYEIACEPSDYRYKIIHR